MTTNHTATGRFTMPDTYLIIGAVALLVFLMSYLMDAGYFRLIEVERNGAPATAVDPASFTLVSNHPKPTLFSSDGSPALFNAFYEGMVTGSRTGGAVAIMAFILLTGGAFGVVMATGAFQRAIVQVVASDTASGIWVLVGLFLSFSLGGAVFGMGEEVIPLLFVVLPVVLRLGYNRITAVLVTYAATQIGFATSWMNPFSVAIAQGIADLPLLSGMPLRITMWCTFTLLSLLVCLRYAVRTQSDSGQTVEVQTEAVSPMSLGDWLVIGALAGTIIWVAWGVTAWNYYLPEIATQFVILGVAAAVIGCVFKLDGMTANSSVAAFRDGAAGLLPAALVVAMARGIVFLMGGDDPTQPSILNTLLHYGSSAMDGLPSWVAAWSMFVAQSVFNVFVTSGSGQAALTMPLMAPLSDLIGVSRQIAVLAFQLGDGLTNILVPTSAALMGCLGVARVDWLDWVRAIAGLFGLLFLLATGFILAATFIGYS